MLSAFTFSFHPPHSMRVFRSLQQMLGLLERHIYETITEMNRWGEAATEAAPGSSPGTWKHGQRLGAELRRRHCGASVEPVGIELKLSAFNIRIPLKMDGNVCVCVCVHKAKWDVPVWQQTMILIWRFGDSSKRCASVQQLHSGWRQQSPALDLSSVCINISKHRAEVIYQG